MFEHYENISHALFLNPGGLDSNSEIFYPTAFHPELKLH